MTYRRFIALLVAVGTVLWVWHVATPTEPVTTEQKKSEEIIRELKAQRKRASESIRHQSDTKGRPVASNVMENDKGTFENFFSELG